MKRSSKPADDDDAATSIGQAEPAATLSVLPVAVFVRSTCGHCIHYSPFNNRATGYCLRYPPDSGTNSQPQVGINAKACGEFTQNGAGGQR